MKIVHVVEPFATGINTFIYELVFGLDNDEHIIIHGERKDTRNIDLIKKEYQGKAQFIKWKNAQRDVSFLSDFKATLELYNLLKDIDFDIIHLHSSKAGVLGRIIGQIKGYDNIVYTPNGVSFLRKDISPFKNSIYKKIEWLFARLNGAIISSSISEKNAFKSINVKSRVINNGTEVNSTSPKNNSTKTFNIVTCGKVTIQKNPKLFNKIAKHYSDNTNIKFKWIGDGELKEELTSPNIEITGWSSKEEVFEHLTQSTIYLSTSLWEGLPFAGIEAMAYKLPLVMFNCDGNRDLVIPNKNGHLFDTVDEAINQINNLLNNSVELESLSENASKLYRKDYSNYKCAKNYSNLYKVIERKNSIKSEG
ncbi:glycosyltransferase [bacterium]|nr:glycosyltransferase [bacterium]